MLMSSIAGSARRLALMLFVLAGLSACGGGDTASADVSVDAGSSTGGRPPLLGTGLLGSVGGAINVQFAYVAGSVQSYTVPTTGWYFLDARGAQGGAASNGSHQGGLGARMQGYVQLTAGDVLRVVVGGAGQKGTSDGNNVAGGGGGGGSFIVKAGASGGEPLLIAGGGGGAGANYDGSSGQDGGFGNGGTNGGGGGIGSAYYGGAGGGGFLGNGGTHLASNGTTVLSLGGRSYTAGSAGGSSSSNGGKGGWGGGAQGGPAKSGLVSNHDGGGGGGGGYSGGAGGPNEGDGGGGGGSFVADTVNTTVSLAQPGANAGDGVVSIRAVPEAPLVQELSNQTALIGQSVTLGPVYVDNTGQTTYQWMKDGVLLPGETGPTLTRDAFKFIDSGAYQVVLHKPGQGTTITRPAFLSATSGAVLGAWDENGFGQLGLGDTADRCTPTVVPGSSNVVAAAAGPFFSLFVKSDGTLWAMGSNNYGQLGLGDRTDRLNPTQVPNVSDVVAVAAGFYHALFLKSDGTVWAMGDNDFGQLGLGHTGEPIATPTRVPGVRDVVAIAAGGHTRSYGAIGHSFFVKRDGSLWAVGRDEKNSLSLNPGGVGLGGIGVITSPTRVPFVGDVVLISTGADYSFVMQRDGTLWGAGRNRNGQLGLGHFDTRYWFTQVPGVSNAIAATVNTFFTDDYKAVTHFVTSDGTASGMGYANLGVLGLGIAIPCDTCDPDPRNTPNRIPNFENVAAVSGAETTTLFLKRDGTLWVTGKNGCQHRTSVPVQVDSPLTRTVASLARGAGVGGILFVTQAPQ